MATLVVLRLDMPGRIVTLDAEAENALLNALSKHIRDAGRNGKSCPNGLASLFDALLAKTAPNNIQPRSETPPPPSDKRLLTYREVAQTLGMSRSTVQRRVAAGAFRTVGSGSGRRVLASDVDEVTGGG